MVEDDSEVVCGWSDHHLIIMLRIFIMKMVPVIKARGEVLSYVDENRKRKSV